MRKNTEDVASSSLPTQELSELATKEEEDTLKPEALNISFDEPTDISEPGKKPSRIKKAFSQVFLTTEDEEKNEKSTKRRKKSSFFTKHIDIIIGGSLFVINLLVPEEYKEVFYINEQAYSLLPTNEHMNGILLPLARIADRHTHIADIHPDVTDALASMQACFAYGMEMRANLMLKRHIEKQKELEKRQAENEVWRNRLNGLN